MTDSVTIKRALLSVSDKTGLVDLGRALAARGVELVSTGGTAKALRDAGLAVRDISDLTGFPEMMDGRVKTLHPKVHGGLLAVRDNPEHAAAMEEHDIGAIDLVVVNLYPFAQTVAQRRRARRDDREYRHRRPVDGPLGGEEPRLSSTIVTDPADYAALVAELDENDGATTLDFRKAMAAKAFAATAAYDATIASWFAFADQRQSSRATLPMTAKLATTLRYGENPHQQAALYTAGGPHARGHRPGRAGAGQGAELQQLQRRRCRARTGRRVPRRAARRW